MSRFVKVVLAVVVAAWATLGGATAGVAATPTPSPTPVYGCLDSTDDYGPPEPCELQVEVLQPFCNNDVPYLRYAVKPVGTPNTTVTITWINPNGADFVQADLPLSGSVLWPGAEVDSDGNPVDWPGWTQLPDGSWVVGDQWDWVRPSVDVKFKVNPEMTVNVAYPPSSPNCTTDPPGEEPPPELSATGSNATVPLLVGGAGLVALGVLLVTLVARRRRHELP